MINKFFIIIGLLLVISPASAVTNNDILKLATQSQWDWQTFDTLPNIKNTVAKLEKIGNKTVYKFSQEIDQNLIFEGYGTKKNPRFC